MTTVGPDVTYMFKALWGGWLLFWLISARGNKRTAMAVGRRWLLAPLAVAAVVWLGGREFPEYVRRTVLPPSRMLEYLGFVITTAGLAFTVWARRALGTNWSGMPTIKQDHELITRGPYAVVRHPIYTGLLLAIFGSCLAGGRLWNLCLFVMAAILLIAKLKAEEALLARRFPETYPHYRRRVKALVPFLY